MQMSWSRHEPPSLEPPCQCDFIGPRAVAQDDVARVRVCSESWLILLSFYYNQGEPDKC